MFYQVNDIRNGPTGWAHIEGFLRRYDEDLVKDLKEDIDTLLVFVSIWFFLQVASHMQHIGWSVLRCSECVCGAIIHIITRGQPADICAAAVEACISTVASRFTRAIQSSKVCHLA